MNPIGPMKTWSRAQGTCDLAERRSLSGPRSYGLRTVRKIDEAPLYGEEIQGFFFEIDVHNIEEVVNTHDHCLTR